MELKHAIIYLSFLDCGILFVAFPQYYHIILLDAFNYGMTYIDTICVQNTDDGKLILLEKVSIYFSYFWGVMKSFQANTKNELLFKVLL